MNGSGFIRNAGWRQAEDGVMTLEILEGSEKSMEKGPNEGPTYSGEFIK